MKTRLSESQAEVDELNQSQSVRTCIVIGPSGSASDSDNLVFITPGHKRRSRKRSQKKMETFGLVLSECDSAYDSDSDSVASEN